MKQEVEFLKFEPSKYFEQEIWLMRDSLSNNKEDYIKNNKKDFIYKIKSEVKKVCYSIETYALLGCSVNNSWEIEKVTFTKDYIKLKCNITKWLSSHYLIALIRLAGYNAKLKPLTKEEWENM